MATAYNKDLTNAAAFFDLFAASDFTSGVASMAASAVTDVITHGLSGTPTFILVSRHAGATTFVADGTSVTFTRAASTAAATYTYFIGVLA